MVVVQHGFAPLAVIEVPLRGFAEPLPPFADRCGQGCQFGALGLVGAATLGSGLWCRYCSPYPCGLSLSGSLCYFCPRCCSCCCPRVSGSLCGCTSCVSSGSRFGIGFAPSNQPVRYVSQRGHRCQTRLLPRCHPSYTPSLSHRRNALMISGHSISSRPAPSIKSGSSIGNGKGRGGRACSSAATRLRSERAQLTAASPDRAWCRLSSGQP